MQPDPELTEEDVCNLLAGTPERIRDQVTGLDASRLTYRASRRSRRSSSTSARAAWRPTA
jgi:hypothetical protein